MLLLTKPLQLIEPGGGGVSGPSGFSVVNAVSWRIDVGQHPWQAFINGTFEWAQVLQSVYWWVTVAG